MKQQSKTQLFTALDYDVSNKKPLASRKAAYRPPENQTNRYSISTAPEKGIVWKTVRKQTDASIFSQRFPKANMFQKKYSIPKGLALWCWLHIEVGPVTSSRGCCHARPS